MPPEQPIDTPPEVVADRTGATDAQWREAIKPLFLMMFKTGATDVQIARDDARCLVVIHLNGAQYVFENVD